MKKYTLLLLFIISSSALFAQADNDSHDSNQTNSASYVYEMYKGTATIYEVDSTSDGKRVLRQVSMDEKFWEGYETERDLYYMQDAKKRGAYVLGTVALASFAFVVGVNDQLGAPEWAIASSGVGAILLTINMFTTPIRANKRKEEILRRRLGESNEAQTQLRFISSGNGIGLSISF